MYPHIDPSTHFAVMHALGVMAMNAITQNGLPLMFVLLVVSIGLIICGMIAALSPIKTTQLRGWKVWGGGFGLFLLYLILTPTR